MKYLLLIISLLFPIAAFSAGITIDINLDTEIDEIEYVESVWDEFEVSPSAADSIRHRSITFLGESPRIIVESEDYAFSFMYKTGSILKGLHINALGTDSETIYPEIQNGFTDYILISGVPYILDEVGNTIWRWNEISEYWVNLSDSMALPEGQYVQLIQLYGNPVVSIEVGSNKGLWYIDSNSHQISSYSIDQGRIVWAADGYYQLVVNNSNNHYEIIKVGSNSKVIDTGLNRNNINYLYNIPSYAGSIYVFKNDIGEYKYFWHDSERIVGLEEPQVSYGDRFIDAPSITTALKGCYSSFPQIFCVFETSNDNVVLYELENGKFRADTILGSAKTFASSGIYGVQAMGDRRYISLWTSLHQSVEHRMLSASPSEIVRVFNISRDYRMLMHRSIEEGVINWIGMEQNFVSLIKIKHKGDVAYLENTFEGASSYLDPEIGESSQEVQDNNEALAPEGEAGGLSLAIILSILMFLSVRKPQFSL